jgi:hypothetical protein
MLYHQLVYRYAAELALKLFMTAEKFKAISRLAPFTLRVGPFYTTIQGIKVLLCAEKLWGGAQAISLALNQRWSGPQMTGPLGTVAYSRLPAGWPRRPHSLKSHRRPMSQIRA